MGWIYGQQRQHHTVFQHGKYDYARLADVNQRTSPIRPFANFGCYHANGADDRRLV